MLSADYALPIHQLHHKIIFTNAPMGKQKVNQPLLTGTCFAGYGDFFRSQATPSRPSASRPQASQRPTGAGALPPLSGAAYGRVVAAQQQLYDSGAGQIFSERLQWLANETKVPVPSATEILQYARAGAGNWQVSQCNGASHPCCFMIAPSKCCQCFRVLYFN